MPSRAIVPLLLLVSPLLAQSEGRTRVRPLYGFEAVADISDLKRLSENVDLTLVQDNGVTEGKNCCRVTFTRGAAYGLFHLGARSIRDWKDFDYFAFDLYTEDDHEYDINFELWDGLSKNYPTRFTQSLKTHKGRQTLLFPINRARRNGKEGRDWEELQPQDKIDLNGLTRVKVFTTPRKDRDAIFWIDNLRLMQEDAARPKMRVPLPPGALAFDFGSPGAVVPGFRNVSANSAWNEKAGLGFLEDAKRTNGGEGWPDLLTGTYVLAPSESQVRFQAAVPDGEYLVWLAAGKVIRPDLKSPHFSLTLNGETLCDEKPTYEELCGEKYLYRFLSTQYSEKPHALWHRYISRMYPAATHATRVEKGKLTLEARGHFLAGLILVPAARKADFEKMVKDIEQTRIRAFEQTYYAPPRPRVAPGAGDFTLFVPHPLRTIVPWSAPSKEEVAAPLQASAARGQSVILRLAVAPSRDLGRCRLELADLQGPGGAVLPAKRIRGYFQNYRSDGKDVSEMALIPSLSLEVEQGVTWCFWLWLQVPEDARPGTYKGAFTFATPNGRKAEVPVTVEVHPFRLRGDLPLSLGMYFHEPNSPAPPPGARRQVLKDLLEWKREIGFTAVPVPAPTVTGVSGDRVTLRFDSMLYELAREVGMGARPEQLSMGGTLGIGRAIGRRLPGSQGAKVDQNPGLELRQPEFRGLYLNALAQYRAFLEKMKLPVAVEVVDEPREVPNPWNRNLADTLIYAKYLAEVPGLLGFVTPMSDSNGGKDYTVLADHVPIVSVHAWKASAGLMKRAREKNRTLWLYNTGMDRFSWGFYNWRVGSSGRWEWHFSWPEDQARGGYPGREWYNPFTALHGLASAAPWTQRGGILFQSAFLNVREGITDSQYLFTLQERVREARSAGTHAEIVREAEQLLTELRKEIPEFPELKGLGGEGDGALIGQGIKDSAAARAGEWRTRIASLLIRLER